MKKWTYQYGDNTIVVQTKLDGEMLIVNGELQDKKEGIRLTSELSGKLKSGEEIKVSLGGFWSVKCNLFVDHALQTPVEGSNK